MATARAYRERLQALRGDIIAIAGECMLEEKEQIVGLLVHQQYVEHVDANGEPLREYSFAYKTEKRNLTGRGDNTDLNLTGEYQQEMNLRVDGEVYEIDSPSMTNGGILKSVWLNEWNEKRGGASVMTLTTENRDRIFPIIKDAFMRKVNDRLALD